MTLQYGNKNWIRFLMVADQDPYYGPRWRKASDRKNFYMHLSVVDGAILSNEDILGVIKVWIDYGEKCEKAGKRFGFRLNIKENNIMRLIKDK